MPQKYVMDAAVILDPLDKLLETFLNKIEREWPPQVPKHPDSQNYLRGFVAIARNLFRTMRYFSADKDREKEPGRRVEYSKSAAPLARVILEILYNVTFMLEDLPARTTSFEKAGWRDIREHVDLLQQAFGDDPEWTAPLARFQSIVMEGIQQFGISPQEAADPESIPYWPIPTRMKPKSRELADFFEYLNLWFYGTLSQDAHVKGFGFMRAFAGLLPAQGPHDRKEDIEKQAMMTITTTAALLAALLSEIQLALRFEPKISARLKELWTLINETSSLSKGLYARRYRDTL